MKQTMEQRKVLELVINMDLRMRNNLQIQAHNKTYFAGVKQYNIRLVIAPQFGLRQTTSPDKAVDHHHCTALIAE